MCDQFGPGQESTEHLTLTQDLPDSRVSSVVKIPKQMLASHNTHSVKNDEYNIKHENEPVMPSCQPQYGQRFVA